LHGKTNGSWKEDAKSKEQTISSSSTQEIKIPAKIFEEAQLQNNPLQVSLFSHNPPKDEFQHVNNVPATGGEIEIDANIEEHVNVSIVGHEV
jgi:hypothetical protein